MGSLQEQLNLESKSDKYILCDDAIAKILEAHPDDSLITIGQIFLRNFFPFFVAGHTYEFDIKTHSYRKFLLDVPSNQLSMAFNDFMKDEHLPLLSLSTKSDWHHTKHSQYSQNFLLNLIEENDIYYWNYTERVSFSIYWELERFLWFCSVFNILTKPQIQKLFPKFDLERILPRQMHGTSEAEIQALERAAELMQQEIDFQNQIAKQNEERIESSELERITNELFNKEQQLKFALATIEQYKSIDLSHEEIEEYKLIKLHMNRASEFKALIDTLKYHANRGDELC